jgi:hypothetical protein
MDADKRKADFHEITNGEAGGNGLYFPGPGWNYNTGYGVPDVTKLTADLAGRTVPAHPAAAPRVPDLPTGSLPGNPDGCQPFGTSPVGNVDPTTLGEANDSLDLTDASMALAPDGKSLVITVHGPHLGPGYPIEYGGSFVKVAWVYAGKTYEAAAQTDGSGTTGAIFELKPDPMAQPDKKAATATYSAGSLTLTVALSDIGNPHRGDRLEYPVVDSGLVTNIAGLLVIPETDDAAGPVRDYTLGQQCGAAEPKASQPKKAEPAKALPKKPADKKPVTRKLPRKH